MRRLLASLVVLVLASVARPTDLTSSIAGLDAAIDVRVAAIGSPAPDAAQAKEAKKLAKCAKILGRFPGTIDLAGLLNLVAAGKALAQSNTADPGVIAAAGGVIEDLIDCLETQEATILARIGEIYTLADLAKVQTLLDAARADVAAAALLAQTDPPAGLAALQTAVAKYGKLAKFVDKTVVRLANQPLPILGFPFSARNANGKPYTVKVVVFDLLVTPPGGGEATRMTADFRDFEDPASGFVLPYKLQDRESEFDMYPTLYRAVAAHLGGTPDGARARGAVRFVSTKHGTVDIPFDDVIFAP
jgi:hypothetical protein